MTRNKKYFALNAEYFYQIANELLLVYIWGSFADGKLGVGDSETAKQQGDILAPYCMKFFEDKVCILQLLRLIHHHTTLKEGGGKTNKFTGSHS